LGKGKVSLKGKNKRPWLEISRSEVDKKYLNHQLRTLRKLHVTPLEVFWDRLATDTYYDKERLRLHSDHLWRVYEILYPQDTSHLSNQALQLSGIHGLTSLWIDQGRIIGRKGLIKGRYSDQEYENLSRWLQDYWNIKSYLRRNQSAIFQLSLNREALETLIDTITPAVHHVMKKKLR